MSYIIFSIIATLFALFFLGLGIYQAKTNKMPIKNQEYSASSPRDLGLIFIYFDLLGFALAINLICHNPNLILSADIVNVASFGCLGIGLLGPVILIGAGIYDLANKRVFGLKSTVKTRSLIKKYHRAIGLSSIAAGILILTAIITTFCTTISATITSIIFMAGIISCLIMCTLICKIESSVKKK